MEHPIIENVTSAKDIARYIARREESGEGMGKYVIIPYEGDILLVSFSKKKEYKIEKLVRTEDLLDGSTSEDSIRRIVDALSKEDPGQRTVLFEMEKGSYCLMDMGGASIPAETKDYEPISGAVDEGPAQERADISEGMPYEPISFDDEACCPPPIPEEDEEEDAAKDEEAYTLRLRISDMDSFLEKYIRLYAVKNKVRACALIGIRKNGTCMCKILYPAWNRDRTKKVLRTGRISYRMDLGDAVRNKRMALRGITRTLRDLKIYDAAVIEEMQSGQYLIDALAVLPHKKEEES